MKHFPLNIHVEIERWRYYMPKDCYVSNLGRIKDKEGRIKNPTAKNHYLFYKGKAIHRMVMEVWNPVPDYENMTVDHLNHNTRDNRAVNLEWVTREENINRALQDCEVNIDSVTKNAVRLNGVILPTETAKQIMKNDRSIANSSAVDAFFDKVMKFGGKKKYYSYEVERI